MKLFKLASISFLLLFIVIGLIGALLPAQVLVSRAININTTKDNIKKYSTSINQWSLWMEGLERAKVENAGAMQADIAGSKITILQITDSTVISQWINKNGNIQMSTLRFITDSVNRLTIVQWQFEEQLKWYPWEKLGSMMNEKILGPLMEKNLNNLKLLAEK